MSRTHSMVTLARHSVLEAIRELAEFEPEILRQVGMGDPHIAKALAYLRDAEAVLERVPALGVVR